MLLPMSVFALLAACSLFIVLFLPLWWLLLLDLTAMVFFGNWSIGFLRIGPNDLTLAFLALGLVLRGRRTGAWSLARLPLLAPWLALAVLLCLSYFLAPINQPNLDSPVRVVYQLLRYAVRPVIYLPVILMLVRSPARTWRVLEFALVGPILCSFIAIRQGYAGFEATPGPFVTGNQLGGVLVMPLLLAMSGTILPRDRRQFAISLFALLVMGRALLFSASRGAIVAAIGGGLVFFAILATRHIGRRRLRYLSPIAGLMLIAALPLVPVILSRPTIAHAVTAADGSKASTMQWRMRERWPHFWAIAIDNPFFGVGTAVDPSLGRKANTPHNGFLSLLVMFGFPAFGLILFFAGNTIRNGVLLYRLAPNPDHRIFGVTSAAMVSGILTHQLVEVTINAPFTFKFFWVLAGTTELAKRWHDTDDTVEVPPVRVAKL